MKRQLRQQTDLAPMQERALTTTQGLVCRIERHQAAIESAIEQASSQQDFRSLSSLLTVDCKRVELLGRLTGAIQEGRMGPATNLQVVVMMPEGDLTAGPQRQADTANGIKSQRRNPRRLISKVNAPASITC